MIKFPDNLPAPLISSDSIQSSPTFSRTAMGSGRSRQRKSHRISTANTTFSFVMSADEVLMFEQWFENEINSGEDWFEINRLTPNTGYSPMKARFRSMYKGADPISLSEKWSITFDAEVYTYNVDQDIWEFPDYIRNQCILDCVVNILWPPLFPEYVRKSNILDYIVNEEWPKDE